MYTSLNDHYRQRFGCKVYKLSLDAGFTCPNRDGTLDTRGCVFCSGQGSGEFAESGDCISAQLERAKQRVSKKLREGKYIAYFQSFTNTYAPVAHLRRVYYRAIEGDDIVGLSVATRPDCLGPEVLELLKEINRQKPVYVELGLQTVKPESVAYIRRGYDNAVYFQAVQALREIGVHVVTHVILGLPGEGMEDMLETVRQAVKAGTDGIKFHLLHVLRGTDLEKDYLAGKFRCLTMEAYGQILKQCLALLPPEAVVHRLTGDGAKRDLIAPMWSADKKTVLNYLNRVLA